MMATPQRAPTEAATVPPKLTGETVLGSLEEEDEAAADWMKGAEGAGVL